jgi:hypothetical protein
MIVSFDFDFTLSFSDNSPNTDTIKEFRKHMDKGDTILIVTSRHFSKGSEKAIFDFLEKHELVANGIFHTGGWKVRTLLALGVGKHFDDDKQELERIEKFGIETVNCFDQELFRIDFMKQTGMEPENMEDMN